MEKCQYCKREYDWEQAETEYKSKFPDGDYFTDGRFGLGYSDCCGECAINFQYDFLESDDDDMIDEDYAAEIYMSSGEDEDYTFGYDPDDLRKHYT